MTLVMIAIFKKRTFKMMTRLKYNWETARKMMTIVFAIFAILTINDYYANFNF